MPGSNILPLLTLATLLAVSGCRLPAPRCSTDADCSGASDYPVCNTTTGTCAASNGTQPGAACTASAECGGFLCIAGRCRASCTGDNECATGGFVCISTPAGSGCRLPDETSCPTRGLACGTTGLACGLDRSCRLPCTGACLGAQQECVAGSCVGRLEPGSETTWFSCQSGTACGGDAGATLTACNVDAPGSVPIDTCDHPALCAAGLDGGTCASPVCTAGATRCEGASPQVCGPGGASWQEAFSACATGQLCSLTLARMDAGTCVPPACSQGETRCRGGSLQVCSSGLVRFADAGACGPGRQCVPVPGSCDDVGMDPTEVTVADYNAFLDAGVSPVMPSVCTGDDGPAPDTSCLATVGVGAPEMPQVCVDWCDAWAYCAWRGRRLCGSIGSGPLHTSLATDPSRSSWMNRCSAGGETVHAAGDNLAGVNSMCRSSLSSTNPGVAIPVGTLPLCTSAVPGYGGAFDLSGNVSEWEDACDQLGDAGNRETFCLARGGSFRQSGAELSCAAERKLRRRERFDDVGFRCCPL